jgi:DNA replication protein DnaC
METAMNLEQLMSDALKRINEPVLRKEPSEADILKEGQRLISAGYMPYDKGAFTKLCNYLAAPNDMGLFLTGKAGTGKTFLFEKRFPKVRSCSATKIEQAWKVYSDLNADFWYDTFGCFLSFDQSRYIDLIVDDLGQEPITKNYGQTSESIERFICHRYQEWQKYRVLSHFTSNLSPVELDKRYGRRVTDRLSEMCAIIEIKGISNRKAGK